VQASRTLGSVRAKAEWPGYWTILYVSQVAAARQLVAQRRAVRCKATIGGVFPLVAFGIGRYGQRQRTDDFRRQKQNSQQHRCGFLRPVGKLAYNCLFQAALSRKIRLKGGRFRDQR